jgi:outer membrane protein OmpA-like peptidoglycan-associated protein
MKKSIVKLSLTAAVLAVGFSGCATINKINDDCMKKGYVGYKYIDATLDERRNNHNILYPVYKSSSVENLLINFKNNSAQIQSQSYPRIKKFSEFMMKNPARKAEIAGYTDSRGSAAYNLDLSQRRADAVAIQVIKNGVSSKRITSKGYGEADPVATNKTAEGRRANRRIEAHVR